MPLNLPTTKNIATNWHVITGAPCSGKTTIIKALEKKGQKVVHEVARQIIDRKREQGHSLEVIKADIVNFEQLILSQRYLIEKGLPEETPVFLDRALPDSIAYYRFHQLDCQKAIELGRCFKYKNIFFLDRLAFIKDDVRTEDDTIAQQLDYLLADTYRMLDYNVIRIPVLPVEKRLDLIWSICF